MQTVYIKIRHYEMVLLTHSLTHSNMPPFACNSCRRYVEAKERAAAARAAATRHGVTANQFALTQHYTEKLKLEVAAVEAVGEAKVAAVESEKAAVESEKEAERKRFEKKRDQLGVKVAEALSRCPALAEVYLYGAPRLHPLPVRRGAERSSSFARW